MKIRASCGLNRAKLTKPSLTCRTIFLVLLFSQYARNVHFPLPVYKAKKGWTSYRLQVFKMFPVSENMTSICWAHILITSLLVSCASNELSQRSRFKKWWKLICPPSAGGSCYYTLQCEVQQYDLFSWCLWKKKIYISFDFNEVVKLPTTLFSIYTLPVKGFSFCLDNFCTVDFQLFRFIRTPYVSFHSLNVLNDNLQSK